MKVIRGAFVQRISVCELGANVTQCVVRGGFRFAFEWLVAVLQCIAFITIWQMQKNYLAV